MCTTSVRSILILSFHLHVGVPCCLFLSGSSTKILCVCIYIYHLPVCSTRTTHVTLHLITLIIFCEDYKLCNPLSCGFIHNHVISCLLETKIFLNTQFSNTLSLCSSLKTFQTRIKLWKLYLPYFNLQITSLLI
jgi:hypothetical protein